MVCSLRMEYTRLSESSFLKAVWKLAALVLCVGWRRAAVSTTAQKSRLLLQWTISGVLMTSRIGRCLKK